MKKQIIVILIFILFFSSCASNKSKNIPPDISKLATEKIESSRGGFYTFTYKNEKPDDIPDEIYERLWQIQKEVIDNFTYDYDKKDGITNPPDLIKKEDFYNYGMGVCEDYANFFYILAYEKGLTANLYKVSGDREGGGHAWLEYRTKNNIYIIDPTWSDDYAIKDDLAKENFNESRVYGRKAFFTTYAEDRIIFPIKEKDDYNHSSYTKDFKELLFINGESAYIVKNRLITEANEIVGELNILTKEMRELREKGMGDSSEYAKLQSNHSKLYSKYSNLKRSYKKIKTEVKLKPR